MAITITGTTSGRVFAFSPASIEITGTTSNQEVIISWENGTLKRYTNTSNKVILPLQKIFKSFFVGIDVGEIASFSGGYANLGSKLILTDKDIIISIGADTSTLTYDIIWGALQVGETEPSEETIYLFGTFPLVITQNNGNYLWDSYGYIDDDYYGKDINITQIITDNQIINKLQFRQDSTVLKTINVVKENTCFADEYLRWIDKTGQYRFYGFTKVESYTESKAGSMLNRELFNLSATSSGIYKGQNQIIDIQGSEMIGLSVPIANYTQQKLLKTLETSIKVWRYLGSDKWVEVIVKMNPIKLDEKWKQNQSIELQIIMPDLYLQTL